MKIKFLSNGPAGDYEISNPWEETAVYTASACFLNMAYFFMKHFYHLHGKNPNIEWLMSEMLLLDDIETAITKIKNEKPDILGLSIHVWNEIYQFEIASAIKSALPDTVIVVGGPQLTAHKDTGFFDSHPYVDYVVYGDGERPFQQIIDYHSGYLDSKEEFVNIVSRDQTGQYIKYPHETLKDQAYFNSSPFLGQQQFLLDHITDLESRGVPRKHMVIGVEFARGCMYKCSFCDWSQNLTKKVTRRKTPWKEELHFFKTHDLALRETDANFGQWDEDLEIFDYAADLYEPGKNFKLIAWNTPKLKKSASYHLLKRNAELFGMRMIISVQDIDQDVLRLMDRPSLSWEEYKKLIRDLKRDVQADTDDLISMQIMLGMAGQSYDTATASMRRIWVDIGPCTYQLNHWTYLGNMPGADQLYQRIHKLEWVPVYVVNKVMGGFQSIDDLYHTVSTNTKMRPYTFESQMIWKTATMSFEEIIAVKIFDSLLQKNKILPSQLKIDSEFEKLKYQALHEAREQMAHVYPLLEKYGFIVYGSYNHETNQILRGWKSLTK